MSATTFGSVASGIEAATVASAPLGWRAAWLSEIDPFACAVLAHHYPDTPNVGDMRGVAEKVRAGDIDAPDVFCGGTPCQAFSVAGQRRSLDDERGNLSLTFCEIADAIDDVRCASGRPECIVFWENVPGVLSTADNAYGCFLGQLSGEDTPLLPPGDRWSNAGLVLGPKRAVAWRVLDAQYFGLAQRRRRVFVVASARNGFDPAAVLFEFDGVRRDTAPSRESGKVAPTIPARSTAGGGLGTDFDCDGGVIQHKRWPAEIASTLDTTFGTKQGLEDQHVNAGCPLFVPGAVQVAHTLRGDGFDASEDGTGRGTPIIAVRGTQDPIAFSCKDHGADAGELSPTLRAMGHAGSHANAGGQVAVAVSLRGRDGGATAEMGGDVATALRASQGGGDKPHVLQSFALQHAQIGRRDSAGPQGKCWQTDVAFTHDARPCADVVATPMAVRRLTPRECERLQGFPDDYTLIPWRGKTAIQCPDGPRYKALGNSWAVPVVAWIFLRIDTAIHGYIAKDATT